MLSEVVASKNKAANF